MEVLDEIRLNFNRESLLLMNICMGLVMFGVALELNLRDFGRLLQQPRGLLAGLLAQLILLPALTYLLVLLIRPPEGVALGMILLACCSGGTISNMLTVMAGGNAALSVSLTASATLMSSVATPANFAFWGNLYLRGSEVPLISISFPDMLETVMLVVGIPLLLGMLFNHFASTLSKQLRRPFRIISLLIFGIFIAAAFAANFQVFLNYIHLVVLIVLLHNALAYGGGFLLGQVFRLSLADKKTLTIETGIQNGGMALILIFNFFDGLGSMAIIAGWWGIWDIFTGLTLAWGFSKITSSKAGVSVV